MNRQTDTNTRTDTHTYEQTDTHTCKMDALRKKENARKKCQLSGSPTSFTKATAAHAAMNINKVAITLSFRIPDTCRL